MILLFELCVAITISPTVLTDHPLANYLVEFMAFIPSVHAFDSLAINPESIRFYMALSFFMLIPKAMAVYIFFKKILIQKCPNL